MSKNRKNRQKMQPQLSVPLYCDLSIQPMLANDLEAWYKCRNKGGRDPRKGSNFRIFQVSKSGSHFLSKIALGQKFSKIFSKMFFEFFSKILAESFTF